MEILVVLIAVTGGAFLLRRDPFVCGLFALLVTPIAGFLAGSKIPLTGGAYWLLLGAVVLVSALSGVGITRGGGAAVKRFDREKLIPVAILLVSYLFLLNLALQWPDFISIGERLRDYALLSGTLSSPVVPIEPWMAGTPLNYYLYWYRFAQMIAALLDLKTWNLYHSLVSLSLALFFSVGAVFFRRALKFSWPSSIFCALLIAIGSNCAGVIDWFTGDANWWGPSRVIVGAINEFPAWSFLLGDLHPHYLNLCLVPFLLLLARDLMRSSFVPPVKAIALLGGMGAAGLWVYNSNAWELPAYLALCAPLLVGYFWTSFRSGALTFRLSAADLGRLALILAIVAAAAFSLYLSSRNIIPAKAPVRFVQGEVARSLTGELLRHWGFPLGLIAFSLVAVFPRYWQQLGVAVVLGFSLFAAQGICLLGAIAAAYAVWLLFVELRRADTEWSQGALLAEACGAMALVLIIFPELFFFDDPYGGENERMNTIFKFYAAAWFPLHAFAFFMADRAARALNLRLPAFAIRSIQVVAGVVMIGFFFQTIDLRRSRAADILPLSQGLSQLERELPGSAVAIQQLEKLPRGIVLEAQGPPYSLTTHVATLSGNFAYLGWENHVNLLSPQPDEIARRKQLTDQIYNEPDCRKKKELMTQEHIHYVVVGPLEARAYAGISGDAFSCLARVAADQQYQIFTN